MERALARVRLEVRVFTTESTPPPSGVGHHLVVVCHMRGCWDAFSEGAADLATALGVEYDDNQPLAEGFMLASPAPVSDKTLLETQQKSSSGKEVNASTGGSEELRTARYLLTLMSSDADWESQVAGCRAVGALALEVAGTGTYHRNHNYAILPAVVHGWNLPNVCSASLQRLSPKRVAGAKKNKASFRVSQWLPWPTWQHSSMCATGG